MTDPFAPFRAEIQSLRDSLAQIAGYNRPWQADFAMVGEMKAIAKMGLLTPSASVPVAQSQFEPGYFLEGE